MYREFVCLVPAPSHPRNRYIQKYVSWIDRLSMPSAAEKKNNYIQPLQKSGAAIEKNQWAQPYVDDVSMYRQNSYRS